LTFDAQNDPTEVFVIRTDGAFTENGALFFNLQGQAQASHIFWIVGTDATISVGSSGKITWDGDILAGSSFTMSAAQGGSGVTAGDIHGCVFSETANTLAGTTNVNGCSGVAGVPEPGSLGLVSLGGLLGIFALRRGITFSRRL
jgi:Ice-binding-like/PEP-CTERM motif